MNVPHSDFVPMVEFEPVLTEHYNVIQQIGRGAFSTVWVGEHKHWKTIHAIKVINKASLESVNAKQIPEWQKEIDILYKLHHPNIVQLYYAIEGKLNIYIVMEYADGGELFDKIVSKNNYSERDACRVVKNILEGIKYLHSLQIAHRDLKPENLLLKSSYDDTQVLISDFGLSRIIGDYTVAFTSCGSPFYVAPEILQNKGYGKEVDLWSIGVITYFLLAGFPPFMGELPVMIDQILKADFQFGEKYWGNISRYAKNFVAKLLVVDPDQRMTAEQALNHDWILGLETSSSQPSISMKSKSWE
eukprot:TRINITY_DN165_c0_g2_i1.p1 TRINITY_DN165_c0_g2~~TRINITY_DN165_c0_g2_i1.p1  ORF type:complete len:302 (+),score=81.58 TRINITY_DN165_c0_g2_i1:41-946(+)